jgi:hypothetical protein
MKLIIDRNTWLRGVGAANSYLLRPEDGKKCCIGILCSALGVSDNEMFNMRGSQRLINSELLPAWLNPPDTYGYVVGDLFDAYNTNDDIELTEDEREQHVAEIFARHDIEVEFVN